MQIHLKIITPVRLVYEDDIEQVSLPTHVGEITVLPNHIPLVTLLGTGVITVKKDGLEHHLASYGGFVEILPDSQVNILADNAERAEDLTLEKVEAAKILAEAALKETRYADEGGHASAVASLERELARMKALRKRSAGRHTSRDINTETDV